MKRLTLSLAILFNYFASNAQDSTATQQQVQQIINRNSSEQQQIQQQIQQSVEDNTNLDVFKLLKSAKETKKNAEKSARNAYKKEILQGRRSSALIKEEFRIKMAEINSAYITTIRRAYEAEMIDPLQLFPASNSFYSGNPGEIDHPKPEQTDHLKGWRKLSKFAGEDFQFSG